MLSKTTRQIISDLKAFSSPARKKANEWFFKTEKGQYGYGDQFLGVSVPDSRKVAKKFATADFITLQELLESPIHEHRSCALIILTNQFSKAEKAEDFKECSRIYRFYLRMKPRVNNWDLVDGSAPVILGRMLLKDPKQLKILNTLAQSKIQWPRRMAMLATFAFIRENDLDLTYQFAERFMSDPEDLMHKATGWMLREAGKKDLQRLKKFVNHWAVHPITPMPRTMLRYAIEKFPEAERQKILKRR